MAESDRINYGSILLHGFDRGTEVVRDIAGSRELFRQRELKRAADEKLGKIAEARAAQKSNLQALQAGHQDLLDRQATGDEAVTDEMIAAAQYQITVTAARDLQGSLDSLMQEKGAAAGNEHLQKGLDDMVKTEIESFKALSAVREHLQEITDQKHLEERADKRWEDEGERLEERHQNAMSLANARSGGKGGKEVTSDDIREHAFDEATDQYNEMLKNAGPEGVGEERHKYIGRMMRVIAEQRYGQAGRDAFPTREEKVDKGKEGGAEEESLNPLMDEAVAELSDLDERLDEAKEARDELHKAGGLKLKDLPDQWAKSKKIVSHVKELTSERRDLKQKIAKLKTEAAGRDVDEIVGY